MGIYNEEDPRGEFRRFLELAEGREGLLPSWWGRSKRDECVRVAGSGGWADIGNAVEKSDVQEHYGDSMMPMKLRILGEKVYGRGFM
ncbi:MYND protein, putative [Glarea lozoyensis ATCC 20868]|uniref:MYND protein, putative n=1 Tax=Glarea lozoyensis (strain ATCC 20868 / MF5171) TaxID=1116229 RepID=S3D8P7_GLAL2|nr:MYND protein, putative [Glarea lozoyensis ATCC 20868]EPE34827.1 MYND protein, putative [Glarea lozoyensis ATCC 20868]